MSRNESAFQGSGRIARTVICGGAAAGVLGLLCWFFARSDELPAGVTAEDYAAAERRFRQQYEMPPNRTEVLAILGETAVADGRLETALACFQSIPTTHAVYGASARLQEAQVLVQLKRAGEAERILRDYISLWKGGRDVPREHRIAAYKWLAYVLSVELRLEERAALLREMHASGLADVFDSKQLYFPHLLIWHTTTGSEPAKGFLATEPDMHLLHVAVARYATYEGRVDEARARLRAVCAEHPTSLPAVGALLECYYEAGDWEEFGKVADDLPPPAADEPWVLTRMRGEWALHREQWDEAIDFFQQVLAADPAHASCQMSLSRAQAGAGRMEERDDALERSRVLARIRVTLPLVTEQDAEASRQLAGLCEQAGMADAAETFRRHADRIAQSVGGAQATVSARPTTRNNGD